MPKIIKALTGGLLALVMAILGIGLTAPAAQAADPRITVCNADYSWERIRAYNNDTGYSRIIYPGGCATDVNDRNGHARVDTDPPGVVDDNSWIKRKIGDPWPTGCYVGENHASDPYSLGTTPYGTAYWNFQTSNCTIG